METSCLCINASNLINLKLKVCVGLSARCGCQKMPPGYRVRQFPSPHEAERSPGPPVVLRFYERQRLLLAPRCTASTTAQLPVAPVSPSSVPSNPEYRVVKSSRLAGTLQDLGWCA